MAISFLCSLKKWDYLISQRVMVILGIIHFLSLFFVCLFKLHQLKVDEDNIKLTPPKKTSSIKYNKVKQKQVPRNGKSLFTNNLLPIHVCSCILVDS